MEHDLEVIARRSERGSDHPPLFVHGSCHAAWCWDTSLGSSPSEASTPTP